MTESTAHGATSQLADGTAAGSWVLDPAGSTAEFRVRHFWGAITVRGTLGSVAGEAAVSPDGTATGRISFDAQSLSTGHKQRDKHLRSADVRVDRSDFGMTWSPLHMASMTALGTVKARFTRA